MRWRRQAHAGGGYRLAMSTTAPGASQILIRSDKVVIGGGLAFVVVAGLAHYSGWNSVLTFVVAAAAVCLLASLVGRSVEQLGDRFGPGATGVLQSALGNLPELFICIFSLKAGLVDVVRAALVGSILANLLLVLGLAFVVGGVRHGVQKFPAPAARDLGLLLLLAVAALMLPALTAALHAPAAGTRASAATTAASNFMTRAPRERRGQSCCGSTLKRPARGGAPRAVRACRARTSPERR